jgi:hypothetical protein
VSEGEIKSEDLSLNGSEFELRSGQLVKANGLLVSNESLQKSLLLPVLANSSPNVQAVYDFLLNMNFYDLPPDSFCGTHKKCTSLSRSWKMGQI